MVTERKPIRLSVDLTKRREPKPPTGLMPAWGGQRTWDEPIDVTLPSGEEISAIVKPDETIWYGDKQIGVRDEQGKPVLTPTFGETASKALGWWEQPKEWVETGMEEFGRGLGKVPIVPKALEFVAPAFEFIHEKLEEPWAAILAAPFSPELAWEKDESWLEHEKREFEAWEAPTYVKGLTEFSMPLWWIPWLGWAGKGAKTLARATRLVKAGKLIPKAAERVLLPTYEVMEKQITKDFYRTLAHWSENMPVVKNMVKAVGGPAALIRKNPQTLADQARNYAVFRGMHLHMGNEIVNIKLRSLQAKVLSKVEETKLLKLDGTKVGVVKVTTEKPGVLVGKKVSMELDDVITHPELYEWIDKAAYNYIKTAHEAAEFFERMAYANGVKLPKRFTFRGKDFQYLPRIVEGVERGKGFEAIKGTMNPFERLVYETALEGVEAGVKYSTSVIGRVELMGRAIGKRIANQHFDNMVKPFGKTMLQRVEEFAPKVAEAVSHYSNRIGVLQKAVQGIKMAKVFKGGARPIHGTLLNTISSEFPALASKIAAAMTVRPKAVIDFIEKMSVSAQKVIGMQTKPIVEALKALPEKATLDNALNVVTKFSTNQQKAIRLIERIYKNEARSDLAEYNRVIGGLLDDAGKMLSNEKGLLKPHIVELTKIKSQLGKPVTGWFEETIKQHPAFAGRIFPKEVVSTLEPILRDRGNAWLKEMAKVSGASRMMVAALDVSAPFIQGLMAFGTNPYAWGKATAGMFRAMANPRWLYRELVTRESSIMDRILHGGSSSMIDFFEAMPVLRKGAGKIFGKSGERFIAETYGRAEVGFLGFSELARDELWKAGRLVIARKGLSEAVQDQQLRELARTLDRMTGVMSTQALGLGLTQRQLESSWIFFAPRYTRAYFSFLGDMLKSGMTGAEARKALAGFALGGTTLYMGVCSALGQQPNFNPRSAQFGTIKVGERYIGVGGVYYGMMRTMADVMATVGEGKLDKLSPLNISRVDNPFYKFLYARTAPLTGMAVGLAIEQKDYMGRPLESPEDYLAFIADKVIPIAAQSFIPWGKEPWQEEPIEPPALAAEFAGMRTFPQSEWDKLKKMRSQYALKDFGKDYNDLNIEQKDQLFEKYADYKQLDTEARDHITLERGEDFDLLQSFAEKKADADYFGIMEPSARMVLAGQMNYRDFLNERATLSKIYQGERKALGEIQKLANPETFKQYKKWQEKRPAEDQDLYKYWEISRKVKRDPDTGLMDWETREQNLKTYLESLNEETRDYIERNKDRRLLKYPPALRMLETIQSEGRDKVDEYYNQPEGKERLKYRRANPTVDAWLLVMGRITRPLTQMALATALQLLRDKGLPETILAGVGGATEAGATPTVRTSSVKSTRLVKAR